MPSAASELVRARKAGRTSTRYGHIAAGGGGGGKGQAAIEGEIAEVALEGANGDRAVLGCPRAGGLAIGGADPAADGGKWVAGDDPLPRQLRIGGREPAADIAGAWTGGGARRHLGDILRAVGADIAARSGQAPDHRLLHGFEKSRHHGRNRRCVERA